MPLPHQRWGGVGERIQGVGLPSPLFTLILRFSAGKTEEVKTLANIWIVIPGGVTGPSSKEKRPDSRPGIAVMKD